MKSQFTNSTMLMLFLCLALGLFLVDFLLPLQDLDDDPNDPNCIAQWAARLEDSHLSAVAQDELARKKNAMKILKALMARDNPESRYQAVVVLGKVPPAWAAQAVPNLELLLADDDVDVRRVTVEILTGIGPSANSTVPVLCKLMRQKKRRRDRHSADYQIIPMALARIQRSEAIPFLVESLRVQPDLMAEIVEALAELCPASAGTIPEIENALRHESPSVRQSLASCLDKLYLQGTWRNTGIDNREPSGAIFLDGVSADEEWTILGDSWEKKSGGAINGSGKLRIKCGTKALELVHTNSQNNATISTFAYQIDGDNLKISMINEWATVNPRLHFPEVQPRAVENWVGWQKVKRP